MSDPEKLVAVVTGANKGIGFATVKLLCERYPHWTVYLTSRDVERGQEAVKKLKHSFNISPRFRQLDIASIDSVREFAGFLRDNHPHGINILINNAGVSALSGLYHGEEAKTRIDREMFRKIIGINYFGLVNVGKALYPLLADGARVVNVSSRVSAIVFSQISSARQEALRDCWSEDELSSMMKQFMEQPDEDVRKEGWMDGDFYDQFAAQWGRTGLEILPYAVSKLGINLLTGIHQKTFDDSEDRKNVAVNCCHPGVCKTDINALGTKPPADGAEVSIYLATIPNGDTQLRGKFIYPDRTIVDTFVRPSL